MNRREFMAMVLGAIGLAPMAALKDSEVYYLGALERVPAIEPEMRRGRVWTHGVWEPEQFDFRDGVELSEIQRDEGKDE